MRTMMAVLALALAAGAAGARPQSGAAGAAEAIRPLVERFAAENGAVIELPEPVKSPNAVAARGPAARAPKAENILFVMREMEFAVEGLAPGAPLVLSAGRRYKLSFENHGRVRHEVLFGRAVTHGEDGLDYREHLFKDVDVDVWGRTMIDGEKRVYGIKTFGLSELELDPGTRLSVFVTVPVAARGDWEIGCVAPGHHQAGMCLPVRIL